MASGGFLKKALSLILPPNPGKVAQGIGLTPTWWMAPPGAWRGMPSYRDHLLDFTQQRMIYDSRSLMETMAINDPDVSAAFAAYLTVADTEPMHSVKNFDGSNNVQAAQALSNMIAGLTHSLDLRDGYQRRTSLRSTAEQLRYMCMLRGACALELVCDENLVPTELRQIDPGSIRWVENTPGNYKPIQFAYGIGNPISMDIPTFFWTYYRCSPKEIYPTSPFVAAINTVAARAQIMDDLYRIMQITGMPRLHVTVLENVIKNAAPANVQQDKDLLRQWIEARISSIRSSFIDIEPDQPIVTTDAVTVTILNEKASGVTLDIQPIINVLNAQNQSALKAVSVVLGRGENGVNTSSTEARIFSMNADALNQPVAEALSRAFTVALQLLGFPVLVTTSFKLAELRPATELEPQMLQKQNRMLQNLSLGLITDEEYHLWMFNRLPPPGSPKLSGTNFQQQTGTTDLDGPAPDDATNAGPLNKSLSPEGSKGAKSNALSGPGKNQKKP